MAELGKYLGVAVANLAKVDGVSISSLSKVRGLSIPAAGPSNFYPTQSSDDGMWDNTGYFINDGPDLNMGLVNMGGITENSFIRFPNITVPQGSTINSAYVTFTSYGYGPDPADGIVNLRVYFNDSVNAVAPTSYAECEALSLTSGIDWNNVGEWIESSTYNTPEIKTILQNIIDDGSWSSGNALMVIIKDNGSYEVGGSGALYIRDVGYSWDYDVVSHTYGVPVLVIDYTEPTELELYAATGPDDGNWSNVHEFAFDNTATNTAAGKGTYFYYTFMRFPNVTIPAGSTIISAILTIMQDTDSVPDGQITDLSIAFHAADNAVAPTSQPEGQALLTDLTTGVDWIGYSTPFTPDVTYQTPDLKSSLQEIIDRPGWSSGNAIMVIMSDNGSDDNGRRLFYTYEAGVGKKPKLEITYGT